MERSEIEAAHRRRIREISEGDPQAPLYHFISPATHCECFDPNGAIFWNGRYHLFYIFQDAAYRTGEEFWQRGHCWGHASSDDLIHWQYHPTALSPESGDPESAIYSGCALVNKEGVPTLIYHGYGAGTCVATALDDDLIHWQKSPRNPVIREPRQAGDEGWQIYNVFDPCVWLKNETYYALLGGQVKPEIAPGDAGDTAYIFRSSDLVQWEYLHPFYSPKSKWTGPKDDCACPKFFALGEQEILLCISHASGTRYYQGKKENEQFYPQRHQAINWPGGDSFAPETMLDAKGRRLMWAWAVDQRMDWWHKGELGVLTLPRVLSLGEDGELQIEPAPELHSLRKNGWSFENISCETDLEAVSGDCLEISLEAQIEPSQWIEIMVRLAPDATEKTVIRYDAAQGEISIDASKSSSREIGWRPHPMNFWESVEVENLSVQRAPLILPDGEMLQLQIFLDRSIIESSPTNVAA